MINFKNISIEELAGIISQKLKEHGIDSVLVGGACVSIYSENLYQSFDLDYVTYSDMKKVAQALGELNFKKKARYFTNPNCDLYIEFVSPPVAIGDEPVRHYEHHKTSHGTIKMLTPTDSVKDRLASYYHWNDRQSLDQAFSICEKIPQKINIREIERWSKKENQTDKFRLFKERWDSLRRKNPKT